MIQKMALTRQDTNIIKGIGILMIMLHNFFHIIGPASGENEFLYDPDTLPTLLTYLQASPAKFIRYLFSYFGHYGVQLFIFISAYGLYKAYAEKQLRYFQFLKKRFIKLYPVLVIAVCLKFVLYVYKYKGLLPFYDVKAGLLKLTLLHNFFPDEALSLSGPWWFFSLIFQFYLIFPLLLRITKKYGSTILLVVAFTFPLLEYMINPALVANGLNLNFTVFGHMEVFCLGIFFADKKRIRIPKSVLIFCAAVFVWGNLNGFMWLFTFAAITILLLAAIIAWLPMLEQRKRVYSFISFTGSISLFLFAVHGMLRHPLVVVAEKYDHFLLTLLLSCVFVACTFLVARLVQIIEERVQKYIVKERLHTSLKDG